MFGHHIRRGGSRAMSCFNHRIVGKLRGPLKYPFPTLKEFWNTVGQQPVIGARFVFNPEILDGLRTRNARVVAKTEMTRSEGESHSIISQTI
jgi:hypothetical protein